MTTVTKVFTFDSGAEGFVDLGGVLTGAYNGADGSPANGCYGFTGDPGGGGNFSAAAATTWEGLGVWPGATVTAVECIAYKVNSDNSGYLDVLLTITDSVYGAIMAAPQVSTSAIVGPTGWIAGIGLGGSKTLTASQASNSAIAVLFDLYSENSGASAFKLDTITFLISFTGGTAPRATADRLGNRNYGRIYRRGETG